MSDPGDPVLMATVVLLELCVRQYWGGLGWGKKEETHSHKRLPTTFLCLYNSVLMGEIWRGSIPCSDNDTEALEGLFSVWGEVALKGEGETLPSFGKFVCCSWVLFQWAMPTAHFSPQYWHIWPQWLIVSIGDTSIHHKSRTGHRTCFDIRELGCRPSVLQQASKQTA